MESRMQGRHRNPSYNEGRGYSSSYRNYNRSGSGNFSRRPYLPPPPPPPPPPRRKEEILMEAGRLAAEYLVYKGLLPASSLPPNSKWQNTKYHDHKGQERDSHSLLPDGRTSALNRLGSMNSDVGNGRRRYNDEYNNDRMGPRSQFRGKRRVGGYGSREYGSDWGRDNERWMSGSSRSREFNDLEDDYDVAPGYHRDRRTGFDQFQSRSENTGESGSENHDIAEDTGSKGSSSNARRDLRSEVDGDLSKMVGEDGKTVNSDAGDEAKSDASNDSKKKAKKGQEEESGVQVQRSETEGESKSRDGLMKLCNFAKVPTKPRSPPAWRSPKKEQGITGETGNVVEGCSGEPMVTSGEDIIGDSPNKVLTSETETKTPEDMSISAVQPLVESIEQQEKGVQSPPGLDSSKQTVEEAEETNKMVGMKRQRDSSLDDEFSHKQNVKAKQSSLDAEKPLLDEVMVTALPVITTEILPVDEEMVEPVDQEKPQGDGFVPKVEPELTDEQEEEQQLLPESFKTCDLNLMHAPEITEIPDDPEPEHLSPSPRLETGKQPSTDFGLSIGNNSNVADDFSRLPEDDKVVQVIDLEDDSMVDASASDPSKSKDEPVYPNLDSFLNQSEHADLSGIQDGYSLSISEFYGSDISRCPSHSDLNNLQPGMGLHDAEGVPNDDDSIYVSLGEIPIGFMEVWDQPPQEYGKFF